MISPVICDLSSFKMFKSASGTFRQTLLKRPGQKCQTIPGDCLYLSISDSLMSSKFRNQLWLIWIWIWIWIDMGWYWYGYGLIWINARLYIIYISINMYWPTIYILVTHWPAKLIRHQAVIEDEQESEVDSHWLTQGLSLLVSCRFHVWVGMTFADLSMIWAVSLYDLPSGYLRHSDIAMV